MDGEPTSFAARININIVVTGAIVTNELQGRRKVADEFAVEQTGNLSLINKKEKKGNYKCLINLQLSMH
jgi:hypothetical protein